MKSIEWIVTTSGDVSIREIAERIAQDGFKINEILEEVGCITGSATEKLVRQLRKINGISDISPNLQIDLGPPDKDETW